MRCPPARRPLRHQVHGQRRRPDHHRQQIRPGPCVRACPDRIPEELPGGRPRPQALKPAHPQVHPQPRRQHGASRGTCVGEPPPPAGGPAVGHQCGPPSSRSALASPKYGTFSVLHPCLTHEEGLSRPPCVQRIRPRPHSSVWAEGRSPPRFAGRPPVPLILAMSHDQQLES